MSCKYLLSIKIALPADDDVQARARGRLFADIMLGELRTTVFADYPDASLPKIEWKVQRINDDKGPVKLDGNK